MKTVLGPKFFERPTLTVAKELIGTCIVRRDNGAHTRYIISETEAYLGEKDLASHARFGRTERNKVMFGKPGYFYIYFVYGMHWLLNIVTEKEHVAGAVLIRGLIREDGTYITGPGRVTKALGVDRQLNMKKVAPAHNLWLERCNNIPLHGHIERTARIGVAYAGAWVAKKYRFVLVEKRRGRNPSSKTTKA